MINELTSLFAPSSDFRLFTMTIDETVEDVWKVRSMPIKVPDFKLKQRKWQWMGAQLILDQQFPGERIVKDAKGKPFLNNGSHLSISHDGDLLALAISSRPIGLDIQTPDPRVLRIQRRFMNAKEIEWFDASARQLEYATLVWACKEAVFKYFGTGVDFAADCTVQPIQEGQSLILEYFGRHGRFTFILQQIVQWNRHIVITDSVVLPMHEAK